MAREYGLVTTTSEQEQQGLQYYENAYIWRANTAQMSVADMKRDIYFSLVEFMYNGYEWSMPNQFLVLIQEARKII